MKMNNAHIRKILFSKIEDIFRKNNVETHVTSNLKEDDVMMDWADFNGKIEIVIKELLDNLDLECKIIMHNTREDLRMIYDAIIIKDNKEYHFKNFILVYRIYDAETLTYHFKIKIS